MHRVPCRRAPVAVLLVTVAVMAAGAASAGAAPGQDQLRGVPVAPAGRVTATKAPTSRLAQTDPALRSRTDTAPVQVLVKLDYDSVATYAGGAAGLAPTSPSATGQRLTGQSGAERAYDAHIAAKEARTVAEVRRRVPRAEVGRSLRVVYGGVAATVPANEVASVLAIPGVVAVQLDELRQPLTDSSPEFVNAPPAYGELGTTANAGQGIIYGNLDTGIWPEHPSFADEGNLAPPPGPARECDYGDNPLTPAVDVFVCDDKLIGGAAFLDTYLASPARAAAEPFRTARDSNGHGTHTASTSAGNIVEEVTVLGRTRPAIHGMAPGASIMEYKVCGKDGCFSSDSAAAVGQAILDGVDVINFSISGGTQPFTDPVELAFLDAYAARVFVAASAGNEGPGAGTVNHLAPWVTSVAASTQTREFATTLTVVAANGDTFVAQGASITEAGGPAPVVLASEPPYLNAQCDTPATPGIFTGKIVACPRGGVARVEKGFNVFQGGAVGMILYNPALADVETDTHWLPTVHLADGTDFLAFLAGHSGEVASFIAGEERDGQGDVMANFSSRGPGGLFIKPDVTAPGVQVLAGDTPFAEAPLSGPPNELFQAIAGTSMSSPEVAGAAILARAVHPDWTPGQVKSALMTTAVTDVVKEDLVTPADPFDFGAGRIDVGSSIYAPLTFDESAVNFALKGSDPVNAVHLNVPSINAPIMPGRLTTTRVATNASGRRERFDVSAQAPPGSQITVTPKRFTLPPGGSVELTITIESTAPIGQQQFGSVQLVSRAGQRLHLPVAFLHTQGSVSLVQGCSPETIQRGGQSTCTVEATNTMFDDQAVDLDTVTTKPLKVTGASGATVIDENHVQAHGVLLDGAEPGIPAVAPGDTTGFIPLDTLGVPALPVGDEEIVNFDIDGVFKFAGQSWNRLGVDSNGYIVVGGGTAEDNNCCNLPTGPSPARPNNVLAPFWTDLDGTGAPGLFVATLTDGVGEWLVVEFRLNVFGTTDLRKFQVWIGLNGAEDITYTYSAPQAAPAQGQDFLVGAENALGQGDMEAVLPTGGLVVTSTDLVPGDTVAYQLTVKSSQIGLHQVRTEMRASRVPGVTVVTTDVRVIQRAGGGGRAV